jgi:hypothetical protein
MTDRANTSPPKGRAETEAECRGFSGECLTNFIESMMSNTKKTNDRLAFNPQVFPMHAMIVSRSASYLASTLGEQKSHEALTEILDDFKKDYGVQTVPLFLGYIVNWLVSRNYPTAATLASFYASHGTYPELSVAITGRVVQRRTPFEARPTVKKTRRALAGTVEGGQSGTGRAVDGFPQGHRPSGPRTGARENSTI